MVKEISPNLSFKGYNLWNALKGNWKTIKEILKVGVPFLLSLQFFKDNPAMIAIVTGIGKLVLDALQYWMKKY